MIQDPKRWAVSKRKSLVLAEAHPGGQESPRYRRLANTVRELSDEKDAVEEIEKLWTEAQEKFLTIGRYLVQAKERFHRSYEATILPQLPFKRGVAFQLRSVALAVDGGRLTEEELPHSYSTAYQLASLPEDHLVLARTENLVRRDVLRREIAAFRSRVGPGPTGGEGNVGSLLREWRRLQAERARVEQMIAALEERLGPNLPDR